MHDVTLLPGMRAVLESIHGAIARAERRVLFETYIIKDDALGQEVARLLSEAAARGVEVRVVYDPLGCEKTPPAFFDRLTAEGIAVRAYRPAKVILKAMAPFPRDHGRIIVVDDMAWTGGAAWAREWLPKELGGEGWYDVCVAVRGPVVDDFVIVFETRWREAGGERREPADHETGDRYPDLELVCDTHKNPPLVYQHHRAAIEQARERVWIENAYFFPSPQLMDDLFGAVARGVDVKVIMPGKSDLPIIDRAARSELAVWIERGIDLYGYDPCMVHSKYAVVDDDWCTVGSYNFNPTSIGAANEVNVIVHDRRFVARVAAQFEEDLRASHRITLEEARSRSFLQQTVDQLANDAINVLDLVIGPRDD